MPLSQTQKSSPRPQEGVLRGVLDYLPPPKGQITGKGLQTSQGGLPKPLLGPSEEPNGQT